MLLKHSITNAKKFFKNTLQTFKSLVSSGYQRLPKTPPFNHFSCSGITDLEMRYSFGEFDNFYTDFTDRWNINSDDDKPMKGKSKSKSKALLKAEKDPVLLGEDGYSNGSFLKFAKGGNLERRDGDDQKKVRSVHEAKRSTSTERTERAEIGSAKKVSEEERNYYSVTQRLKELELMDVSNVDHVLDIEEVLHYYSRLTCPAYLDMVDRFFTQIYSEFFLARSSFNENNI
ncbi:hypothetical protein Scep_007595 [Stephania cephalantha]|uniref:OVATE domain-containing protein n=1 Tax=Stephania cephalantha TaxID=152367 RepID=A0AAP0PL99_9MAGN